MKRLTTDNPKSNMATLLNYAYAEDNEVKLRYGEYEGQPLHEYIANRAKPLCECDMTAQEIMDGACFECEPDCALGILNTVAIQAAELRARLKDYEDTGLSPETCKKAEVLPFQPGEKVYIKGELFPGEVTSIAYTTDGPEICWVSYDDNPILKELWNEGAFTPDQIGKTVFREPFKEEPTNE